MMDIEDYFRVLGMEPVPGLATAYPELARSLAALYTERMAKLSFLPPGWLGAMLSEHGAGGLILYPSPTTMRNGATKPDLPPWLRTAEARGVWDKISAEASLAVNAYGRRDAAAGALKLRALQANAAFWDAAYRAQKALREAATNIFGGVSLVAVLAGVAFLLMNQRGRK